MIKKIIAQSVCAILLFLMGFAYGGYRGTRVQLTRSFAEGLNNYCIIHSVARAQENEKFNKIATDGINLRVQILREIEEGIHTREMWLSAFSIKEEIPDYEWAEEVIRSSAKYPISNVPGLTEKNLAYLKSKHE